MFNIPNRDAGFVSCSKPSPFQPSSSSLLPHRRSRVIASVSEKAESEFNENEIACKEENQENEQELKMPEKVQGDGDGVTSSEDATLEDIKETTIDQHVTTVDKSNDAQEVQRIYDVEEHYEKLMEHTR
ncbi:hypothetical protein L2E82_30373 [Cichorium intybus]|uniref:Uncharacterized protein n=1 Tax=Cichorium intybus TaxID=13427 RepID=A0ACB9D051_CICIN|nr:hypothetical protein L2E82_30373 [Cichorium intybus]